MDHARLSLSATNARPQRRPSMTATTTPCADDEVLPKNPPPTHVRSASPEPRVSRLVDRLDASDDTRRTAHHQRVLETRWNAWAPRSSRSWRTNPTSGRHLPVARPPRHPAGAVVRQPSRRPRRPRRFPAGADTRTDVWHLGPAAAQPTTAVRTGWPPTSLRSSRPTDPARLQLRLRSLARPRRAGPPQPRSMPTRWLPAASSVYALPNAPAQPWPNGGAR